VTRVTQSAASCTRKGPHRPHYPEPVLVEALRLIASPQFGVGLALGAGGLATGVLLGRLQPGPQPVPAAGLLFAAAGTAGLVLIHQAPLTLLAGVALLAASEWAAEWRDLVARWSAVIPGAALVALSVHPRAAVWTPWLVGAVIVGGAPLVTGFDRDHPGWGPPFLALSVLGVLGTVPDTEAALVLAGAALPVAVLGWPFRLARLGSAGSLASLGLVCWMVGWGGGGRDGAVLGGLACLGLLLAEPLARLLSGRRSADLWGRPGVFAAGTAHLLLVLVASRVAGLQQALAAAAVVALPSLGAAVLLLAWRAHRAPAQVTAATPASPQ
jgi:hypothetical protein